MVAGMQRIIRETGAEYTNCYLHICTDTVLRNCNISSCLLYTSDAADEL